jgi:hypothetical protein
MILSGRPHWNNGNAISKGMRSKTGGVAQKPPARDHSVGDRCVLLGSRSPSGGASPHSAVSNRHSRAHTAKLRPYPPDGTAGRLRFAGISRIRVTAKASNSWVKCMLRPCHGGVTRYTLPSSPRRLRGRAYTMTHSLLKTLRCRPVTAGHRGGSPRTMLRPQRGHLFDLKHERGGTCLKPRLDYTPSLRKPQQLSQRPIRRHRRSSSCGRQATPRYHWE